MSAESPQASAPLLSTAEGLRLQSTRESPLWRRWGPYLSERQWGTVREDYSPKGEAWDYLPHDQARSRAYRWGEDGLAGFSDDRQHWCLGLALWNGRDAILKERLFGLANEEGNHGEDVKELYYYLEGTPTHSYMRMLYKYPQAAYPYEDLLEQSKRRSRKEPEYEITDTGLFDENRYFDVSVEYAKASPLDVLMRIRITNRGPDQATLHVLPQLWARNIWAWKTGQQRPSLSLDGDGEVIARHPNHEEMRLCIDDRHAILFCDNETNTVKLFGAPPVAGRYYKDGVNARVVDGDLAAVNPANSGTKCAAWMRLELPAGGRVVMRLRFRPRASGGSAFDYFDEVMRRRREENDEFYAVLQKDVVSDDAKLVQRQALAGMLWSKQFYYLDIPLWLDGDPGQPPPPPERKHGRNADWRHVSNADIISMPDKWEYPWYASWDLAFHTLTFAMIDPEFAKSQLLLLTRDWYIHPNAQLPAYEWGFDDANPPVHAWAAWRVYQADRALAGVADRGFLERIFHKLMMNFTWWVNRKDASGKNIFQGGFLGLDNIGIFDRSQPLPTGGTLSQSDGTAWMAMYALNLMNIALELAHFDIVYEDVASKFFEHFLYIAEAAANTGGLWDDTDLFFYDVLNLLDGRQIPMRIRSIVGLIPIYAVQVIDPAISRTLPGFTARLEWFLDHRPDLARLVSRWAEPGAGSRNLLSLLRGSRLKSLLKRMLDETEFLSDYGIRAISKYHQTHPYAFHWGGRTFEMHYVPGESDSGLFGGNSNWRGPVWMPINYMLIEQLREFHRYYSEDFRVECPTGSGTFLCLAEIADELSRRLIRLFLRGKHGRPALGDCALVQHDPQFCDNVLFYEYYHGDTGRGLGASHQTGWSGLVALLITQLQGDPL